MTGAGGAVLGTATVQPDGTFQVTIDRHSSTARPCPSPRRTTPATTHRPAPSPHLTSRHRCRRKAWASTTAALLSGQGEAGSTVEVRNAAGDLLGTIPVAADGTFEVLLTPAQTNGEVLSVVLIDGGGNASPSATFTADDSTAPAAPTGLTITRAATPSRVRVKLALRWKCGWQTAPWSVP